MKWIPLKDAIEKHELSDRTIGRRIATLKKIDPVLYIKIIRKAKRAGHNMHEVLEKEFFAFLNTDIRVFKRANLASYEKKEGKTADDIDPSFLRMLIELLQVNDLHEIEPEYNEQIKEMLHSTDTHRWQRGVRVCYHYSYMDDTLTSACKIVGVTRKTFNSWVRSLPLLPYLYSSAQTLRDLQIKTERKDRALHSLGRLIEGYDKVLQTRKYKIKMLPSGKEVLIAYEMQEQAKHVVPNINAIGMELYNHAGDEYKRFTPFEEMTRSDKPIDNIKSLTDEQLDEEIKLLESEQAEQAD